MSNIINCIQSYLGYIFFLSILLSSYSSFLFYCSKTWYQKVLTSVSFTSSIISIAFIMDCLKHCLELVLVYRGIVPNFVLALYNLKYVGLLQVLALVLLCVYIMTTWYKSGS